MSKSEKNNYTQLPNVILDEYLPLMGIAELKVVMFVARKTFGWQKEDDKISLSQMEDATGLSRQGVIDGVNAAIERGVLCRVQVGQGFLYHLNIDENVTSQDSRLVKPVDQSSELTSQDSRLELVKPVDQSSELTSQDSRLELVKPVDQSEQKLVKPVDTQKKDIKEIEIKNTTSSGGDGSFETEQKTNNEIDDSEWQSVIEAYESNIGVFTAMSSEMVRSAFDDYGAVLVVDAIKAAVSQNVRKWSYVDGILKRWKADGRKAQKPTKVEEKQKTIVIFNQYTNQREVKVIQ